jgi:hypothetical protein
MYVGLSIVVSHRSGLTWWARESGSPSSFPAVFHTGRFKIIVFMLMGKVGTKS